jgi:hypothetical protein
MDAAENYYLMGYLPSATEEDNNFLTYEDSAIDTTIIHDPDFQTKYKDDPVFKGKADKSFQAQYERANLKEEEGMVLRYKQTGKKDDNEGADRYSEIGFYRRQTQWKSSDSSYKGVPPPQKKEDGSNQSESEYSALLVSEGFPKNAFESNKNHINRITGLSIFPHIDQINIQSTGDIHTTAQNHQQLKAKRFELLVDCKDTIHTKAELSKDELPLGDNIGDDSVLHAGDAHIRAGNRVVIKAGEEIVLQVGKTVVKISDDGFNVKSKLVNSNLTNAYDATFSMSGKDGISMFGREAKITADKSFGIGDTFGGSVGSELGVVSIGGREIKAEVYDSVQYGFLVAYALAQYIQSITSGSMGINGNVSDSQVGDYIKFSFDTLKDGTDLIKNIVEVVKKWEKYQESMNDAYIAAGGKAEKEKEAEIEEAEDEKKAEIEKIEKERDAKIREAEQELAKGKIKEDEAKKKMKEAENEAKTKTEKAEKERKNKEIDANLTADKKKEDAKAAQARKEANEEAAKTRKQADEDAAKTRKDANQKFVEGDITKDQAEELKTEATKKAMQKKKSANETAGQKIQTANTNAQTKKTQLENKAKQDKR